MAENKVAKKTYRDFWQIYIHFTNEDDKAHHEALVLLKTLKPIDRKECILCLAEEYIKNGEGKYYDLYKEARYQELVTEALENIPEKEVLDFIERYKDKKNDDDSNG